MTRIDLITLQQIRDASPCKDGWNKLLNALGGANTPLTTVVSIGDVAKANDAQDALWCCRLITDRRFIVSLIMPSVKRASKHTDDIQVHDCIAELDKWLSGDDSVDLKAAASAARAAYAADAARAAYAAAADYAADAASDAYAASAARAAYAAASAAASDAYAASAARAAYAASAARAARAAAYAAAADYAADAERSQQITDIIAISPLYTLAGDK